MSWTVPLTDLELHSADPAALTGAASETIAGLHLAERRTLPGPACHHLPALHHLGAACSRPLGPGRSRLALAGRRVAGRPGWEFDQASA